MNCPNCGNVVKEGSVYCGVCGLPVNQEVPVMQTQNMQGVPVAAPVYGQPYVVAPTEQKGLSIASLVLGLIGLIAWIIPIIGFVVTILGFIFGCIGIKKGGKGMAIAGIVLSVICFLVTIAYFVLSVIIVMEMMENGMYSIY